MIILRWFISPTVRNACSVHKHFRRLLSAQRDILSSAAVAAVQVKLDELTAAIKEGHTGRINIKAEELQFAAEKNIKAYPHAAWRENVEVLLVALAVAMAIRTFFLQPFKIPTGSMQPTLFGVTVTPDFSRYYEAGVRHYDDIARTEFETQSAVQKNLVIPTGWQRVKEWFEGDSYVHVVAKADGPIDSISQMHKLLIFNLWQTITIDGVPHTILFPPDYGESDLQHRAGLLAGRVFHKGDDVIKMKAGTGDHLFVDRLTYNFARPTRGDTIVFETLGIPEDKRSMYHIPADEFYIKRLVALPGEKVSIGNDRHLRINGEPLNASTPHFERVYGFNPNKPPQESQWSGHVNGSVAQEYKLMSLSDLPVFPDEETVVDVPASYCMPMGDNTCNSLDSRFWGPIPEKYVIGKSFFVYWPLTDRFGWGNR